MAAARPDLNSKRNSSTALPGAHESTFTSISGESGGTAQTMNDEQMPPRLDPTKPGARSRRSRSNPPQRVPHSSGLESGSDYPTLSRSVLENENVRDEPPASFIPQSRHFPPPAVLSYNRRSDFVGPYAMPAQSGSMNTPHPPPSYAFTPYQHSIPKDMHTGFQTYPSTTDVPPYSYHSQTYPSPQMYRPSYPTPAFGQQFPSQGESGPQLRWCYFPHPSSVPSPQFHDSGPPYQSHYAVGYSEVGHSGMDHSLTSEAAQSGPPENHSSSSSRYHGARSGDYPPLPRSVPLQHSPPVEEMSAAMPMEGGSPPTSDRPLIRRSFHPNPPADRSDWVMWVGNVPADATHDEIWQFFIAAPAGASMQEGSTSGVVSVFLIARSSCAFINYRSIEDLQHAITRFDGVPLRANDLSCPRLVCRARKTNDDLKGGVGYQRGMGMHTRWVTDQKHAEGVLPQKRQSAAPDAPSSPGSASDSLAGPRSDVSPSSDDDVGKGKGPNLPHSSSSDSYSSTNSSFLTRYFPIRYFILKSLSQGDLDISVSRGIWATQKHNEEILDQAFRTSKEVYLIFGVNKSREFYGYARMNGPVLHGQIDVQWTSRSPHQSPAVLASQISSQPGTSDHRLVDSSPLAGGDVASTAPTSGGDMPGPVYERHPAPALLKEENRKHSLLAPTAKPHSEDQQRLYLKCGRTEQFALDTSAPGRAIWGHEDAPWKDEPLAPTFDLVHEEDVDNTEAGEETNDLITPIIQAGEGGEVSWGDSFAVEWLCRERLSFNTTRHLRNPWNRDKEIKVSRDGTELEPSVGRQLLQDWHKIAELPSSAGGAPGRSPINSSGRRRPSTKFEYTFPIIGGGDRLLNVVGAAGLSRS